MVTILACADTQEVESTRADYIRHHTQGYVDLPFDVGLNALEGALAIGRQANPLGPDEVQVRMDAARVGNSRPTKPTTPDKPLLSKVKSWLTTKEIA